MRFITVLVVTAIIAVANTQEVAKPQEETLAIYVQNYLAKTISLVKKKTVAAVFGDSLKATNKQAAKDLKALKKGADKVNKDTKAAFNKAGKDTKAAFNNAGKKIDKGAAKAAKAIANKAKKAAKDAEKAFKKAGKELKKAFTPRLILNAFEEPSQVCCKAITADCLACSQGVSLAQYCAANPNTYGCTF